MKGKKIAFGGGGVCLLLAWLLLKVITRDRVRNYRKADTCRRFSVISGCNNYEKNAVNRTFSHKIFGNFLPHKGDDRFACKKFFLDFSCVIQKKAVPLQSE